MRPVDGEVDEPAPLRKSSIDCAKDWSWFCALGNSPINFQACCHTLRRLSHRLIVASWRNRLERNHVEET